MIDEYEVIIPERIYVVNGLEGVKKVIERYKLKGFCVKLIPISHNKRGKE